MKVFIEFTLFIGAAVAAAAAAAAAALAAAAVVFTFNASLAFINRE